MGTGNDFNDQPWKEANSDAPNFMTPTILERGRSGDWAWEISEGRGFENEAIYGVTFLWWNGDAWRRGSDIPGNPNSLVFSMSAAKFKVAATVDTGWTETCRYCQRTIEQDPDGTWIDPEATGDDSIWRETCDSNDTERAAPHEPIKDGA